MTVMSSPARMRPLDNLLAAGLVLAPMTGLRVGKVGPGEILVLAWCLTQVPSLVRLKLNNLQVLFWMVFLGSIVIGTAIGLAFYPEESLPSGVLTFAYLMFVALAVYAGLHSRSLLQVERLLKRLAIGGSVYYCALFLYARYVAPTVLSAPLWYAEARFSGGADNPHQLAVLLGALLFVDYRSLLKSRTLVSRLGWSILAAGVLVVGLATGSSTLVLAVVVTFAAVLFVSLSHIESKTHRRRLLAVALGAALAVLLVLTSSPLLTAVRQWVEADPNGIGRFWIFASITDAFAKSPLFGLGVGTHAVGGTLEFHNTYLEILAMSGVVGLTVFTLYSWRIFRSLRVDHTLLTIMLPLYVYGLAGFALRRLVYWVLAMVVVVIAEKMRAGDRA